VTLLYSHAIGPVIPTEHSLHVPYPNRRTSSRSPTRGLDVNGQPFPRTIPTETTGKAPTLVRSIIAPSSGADNFQVHKDKSFPPHNQQFIEDASETDLSEDEDLVVGSNLLPRQRMKQWKGKSVSQSVLCRHAIYPSEHALTGGSWISGRRYRLQ
jgi:hypothetical protein